MVVARRTDRATQCRQHVWWVEMTRAEAISAATFAGECGLTATFAMALALLCLAATKPSRNLVGAPVAAGGAAAATLQADLTVLTSFDPFHRGAVPVVEAVETEDAPETSLNLTLSFVRVATEPEGSVAAIVGPGNAVQRYRIGDEVIPGVQLRSIQVDRVLLGRADGAVEALTLDDGMSLLRPAGVRTEPEGAAPDAAARLTLLREDSGREAGAASGEAQSARSDDASGGGAAGATRLDVAALDARALAQSVRAEAVALDDGRPGLRLTPQGDGQALIEAGLEPGDVVLEIQGRRVRDEFDLLNAMASLEEGPSLSFLVNRNGSDMTITLEFTSSGAGR